MAASLSGSPLAADRPLAWVTGAGGLIGSYVVRLAPQQAPHWRVRGWTRDALDLTDYGAVTEAFCRQRPALIVHCAALSQSPACQADPRRAHTLNVSVVEHLAQLAVEVPLVLLSSDLVFDGQKGHYLETDPVGPLSVYGETKVLAEQCVLANPRHLVVRTSLNGGASPKGDRGFNEELRLAWQAGRTLKLFTDEFRSPMFAGVTARALWELVKGRAVGLFHVGGSERLSRWQMGQLVAARWPQLAPRLEPASRRDYRGAPRPPDTSLDCAKAQLRLSFRLPGLTRWLAEHPDEPF
ncbi:MAG: SDR family oxidoreductase [Verrucomicrobia bacterium]|nr:SDR family oxidoreductase [Verrucomicrobiota bacterium]